MGEDLEQLTEAQLIVKEEQIRALPQVPPASEPDKAADQAEFIREIIQQTQPTEKIEKNLMVQYVKANEPVKPGTVRAAPIPFIQKLSRENHSFDFHFDPLPLMRGICSEYKIDFDEKLTHYYVALTRRCGAEIYDLECLDQNAPPLYAQYRSRDYLQQQTLC